MKNSNPSGEEGDVGLEGEVFFERHHDYKQEIEESTFGQDYDLTEDEIDRLDFLLNEHHGNRNPEQIKRLRNQAKNYSKLLAQASSALSKASELMKCLGDNGYALSSAFSATNDRFKDNGIDENIERFNQNIEALNELTSIIESASSVANFSDGLPKFEEGAQSNPALDLLLRKLVTAVREIFEQRTKALVEEDPTASSTEPSQESIAEGVSEILAIAGISRSSKTIANRLSRPDFEALPPTLL